MNKTVSKEEEEEGKRKGQRGNGTGTIVLRCIDLMNDITDGSL